MILWDKTMDDKLINIPNDDKQNYLICELILFVRSMVTTSLKPTNQNSKILPKVCKPKIKITWLKKFLVKEFDFTYFLPSPRIEMENSISSVKEIKKHYFFI